jgi:hypothetical protein
MIDHNSFSDNWGGVVLWQNANRYSGDGQDPGGLIPPPGQTVNQWIDNAQTTCPSHLTETSPIDYHDLCHWFTQNVSVLNNTFSFNPTDTVFNKTCTQAANCGQSGLFSDVSVTPAYPGYTICNAIANNQNNVFDNNAYTGPWTFYYFNQGDVATPAQWQNGLANVESSGYNFPAEDIHSKFM